MTDAFDPYYSWLSIPPEEQPPNHYRLLGVKLLESNADVIANAADRQMAHVRSFQSGKHSTESQKLLNELASARLCLLAADKKAAYDRSLRAQLAAAQATAAPPVAPTPARAPAPIAVPARPLRVAQPVAPMQLVTVQSVPANPLDFDPLAESTSPRHRKRKSAARQPALLVGAGAALVAVVGLVWALTAGSSDRPMQSPTSQIAAANRASSGADPSTDPTRAANQAGRQKPGQASHASDTGSRAASPESSAENGPAAEGDDVSAAMADSTPEAMDDADRGSDHASDAAAADHSAREPVPAEAALKTAVADVQASLKAEFSAAKKPAQKVALAEKLLALAQDSNAAVERYALLSEAKRLAASAAAVALAMQATDAIAEQFDVDRLASAAELLDALGEKELSPAARSEVVEVVLPLVDEAAAGGQFKLGRRLATIGLAVARKANQADAIKTLTRQTQDLAAAEKLADTADAARKVLETKPDDGEAHLTLGKYLCLVVGDWESGLPHLRQSTDPSLRSAAEGELAGSESAAERMKLGDLWWDLADGKKESEKNRYHARAGYWYEQAVGGLTGLTKIRVEKRLEETAGTRPNGAGGGVIADKLVLWNCNSNQWRNRGILSANIELRRTGKVVWSKKGIPVAWSRDEEPATTIPLPKIPFDALRVETASFQELGSALCEIEVFRGRNNLARGKPAIASATYDSHSPAAVVDGITNSSRVGVGYWVAPDRQRAWLQVQVAPPAPPSGKTVHLSDLPAIETQVHTGTALTLPIPVGGVTSPHGLFMHPADGGASHVAFALDKKYQVLSGAAAVGDTAGERSATALTFRIVGDGKELWRATIQNVREVQPLSVRVGNVSKLELFVDCPGSVVAVHAIWVNMELTHVATVSTKTPTTKPAKPVPDQPTTANGGIKRDKWISKDATYTMYPPNTVEPPLPSLLSESEKAYGSPSDEWAFQAAGQGAYIVIDLKRSKSITGIYIRSRPVLGRGAGIRVYLSNKKDDPGPEVWAAGPEMPEWTIELPRPQKARYITIGLDPNKTDDLWFHLRKVKVYGSE